MEDQKTSTPLSQLRAQAAAMQAEQQPSQDPVAVPPATPPPEIIPAPAPAPPPPAPPPPPPQVLPPVVPSNPPVAPRPPVGEADVLADLAAAEPLKPVQKPPVSRKSPMNGLLDMNTMKLGVAVMFIFIVVTGLPVEAITNKFSFLKKLPFSSTMIKAITAGAAAATVSTSLCAGKL